jgi:hypothetical protein
MAAGKETGELRSIAVQPPFKSSVSPLQHLSVNLSLVRKLRAPACVIPFLTFKLDNEFLDKHTLGSAPLSEMLLAQVSGFL